MPDSSTVRDIRVSSLSNGVKVITEPMPSVRSAACGYWIGTGSRSEKKEESGISHFIEHMLFKGTPDRSAEDIARQMDSLGGHLDAFTGRELVGFNFKVLDEHLPAAFEILADMLQHPRFDSADIEKEKGVILEELKMETDNPESFVHEMFVSNFWRRHPLGQPILGTRKTISGFAQETMAAYHRRFYTPANLTITAAGSIRHDEVVKLAEIQFGGLPASGAVPHHKAPKPQAPIILRNKRSLQQVHFCLGVPCYPTAHPLRFACYTLNVVLGGGMSSRLFQNIRERQGLAYSIFSELNMYQDAGLLAVYAGTSTENVPRLLGSTLDELHRLKQEQLTQEELRRAKEYMKGSLLLSLESTTARMGNLARQWLNFGQFYSLDEIADSIEKVTAEDLQQVAREFFQPEKIGLSLLGRLDGLKLERSDLHC
jgi:predicted Zn-dependent peptidase